MAKSGIDQPFQSKILYDAIRSIYDGMNSGVDPQSVPRTQASFLRNTTVRGTFPMPRPAQRKITLAGSSDLVSASLAAILGGAQVFQCACYHRAITGTESVMVAVSGRLFQFAINGTTATITELTTPSLQQSPVAAQAWMWQAERFLIFNDGTSLPLIWDGTILRRSGGVSQSIVGTTNANIPITGANQSVDISLAGPYTGPIGAQVTVTSGGTDYTFRINSVDAVAGTSGFKLDLQNIYGGAGETVASGTQFRLANGFVGVTPRNSSYSSPTMSLFVNNLQNAVVGAQINVWYPGDAGSPRFSAKIQAITPAGANPAQLQLQNVTPIGSPGTFVPTSSLVLQSFPGASTVATTNASFVDPIPGATVTNVLIASAYTNTIPLFVYVGSYGPATKLFQITAYRTDTTVTYTAHATGISGNGGALASPLNLVYTGQELPAGRMGVYGMGRNWMCLIDGQSFIASDIVDGASGTAEFNGEDAVLSVTENNFLAGGGTFRVPGAVGQITAMIFTAQMDTSLGQGPLAVGTQNVIFSCQAPVDRTTWQNLTNPILTESVISNGTMSHYGTINANSDVIMRSKDGIRSMIYSRRDFDKWRNGPISREVDFINSDNPQLLSFASSIDFDNRLLMTTGPTQTGFGVVHSGIIALNFDPISSLKGAAPACYDGLWDAPAGGVLQLVTGQFSGQQRAFAVCVSADGTAFELWEIMRTDDPQYQDDSGPIVWDIESGALNFYENDPRRRDYMTLKDGELRIDMMNKTYGRNGALITASHQVKFEAFYKGDQDDAWQPWYTTTQTFPDPSNQPADDPGYRSFIGFGEPDPLQSDPVNDSPMRDFTTMQFRIRITGHCRLLSARFKANTTPIPDFAAPTQPT